MRIVIEIDQGDAVTLSSTTATVEPAQDVDAGAAPAPAATTESAPPPALIRASARQRSLCHRNSPWRRLRAQADARARFASTSAASPCCSASSARCIDSSIGASGICALDRCANCSSSSAA